MTPSSIFKASNVLYLAILHSHMDLWLQPERFSDFKGHVIKLLPGGEMAQSFWKPIRQFLRTLHISSAWGRGSEELSAWVHKDNLCEKILQAPYLSSQNLEQPFTAREAHHSKLPLRKASCKEQPAESPAAVSGTHQSHAQALLGLGLGSSHLCSEWSYDFPWGRPRLPKSSTTILGASCPDCLPFPFPFRDVRPALPYEDFPYLPLFYL